MFIAVLFTIVRKWKQLKYASTDKWIIKIWHIYTKPKKNNKIINIAGKWVVLEKTTWSERTQVQRSKCGMGMS